MAANPKSVERGKAFLERVLKRVPEESRKTLSEQLQKDEELLDELGKDGLRQDEFSRLADELRQGQTSLKKTREELVEWQKNKLAQIGEIRQTYDKVQPYAQRLLPLIESGRIKEWLDGVETGNGNDDGGEGGHQRLPSDVVRRDQLTELVKPHLTATEHATFQRGMSAVAVLQRLSNEHYHTYQEPLDTEALLRFCNENNLEIRSGYAAYTREAREKRETEAREKREEELREEGRKQAREQLMTETPASLDAGPPQLVPHMAHVLRKEGRSDADVGVDAAVAHFNKLRASKAS